MKNIFLAIATCLSFSTLAEAQTFNNVLDPGTGKGTSVIATSDGNYLFVGHTTVTSNTDILVVKTTTAGAVLWQKRYGFTGTDEFAQSVVEATSGGGYIIVGFQANDYNSDGDALILRITSAGALSWMKKFGGTVSGNDERLYHVMATSDGNYLATGQCANSANTNDDIYMLKFSATILTAGSIWQKRYDGTSSDRGYWTEQLSDGSYITAARSVGSSDDGCLLKTTSTGGVSWAKRYGSAANGEGFYCVQIASGGDYAVAGPMSTSVFAARTTSSGTLSWAKTIYTTGGVDDAYCVREANDGGLIYSGFGGSLTKLDASGSYLWSKTHKSTGTGLIYSTDLIYSYPPHPGTEEIVMTGTTYAYSGTGDFYFAKTDGSGVNCGSSNFAISAPAYAASEASFTPTSPAISFSFTNISPTTTTLSYTEAALCPCTANAGPDKSNLYRDCCIPSCTSVSIGTAAISGLTYSWSPGTGLSCTTCAQPNASPCSTTIYTVTVEGNCLDATDNVTVTTVPSSCCGPKRLGRPEDEVSGDWFDVYPNPSADGYVQLQLHPDAPSYATLRITDMQGRLVLEKMECGNLITLDLTKQPAGIYLATLSFDDKVVSKKITIGQ